jgi:hypothetical protein
MAGYLDRTRVRCPYDASHWGEAVYQVLEWDSGSEREFKAFRCDDDACRELHPPANA